MTMTFAEAEDLHQAVVGRVAELGLFERVNDAQPKNRPGRGLTAHVYLMDVQPLNRSSGLASTSIRAVFVVRIMHPADASPEGRTEAAMLHAAVTVMVAFSSDYTLGGRVRAVDIRGMEGEKMRAQTAYITWDQQKYRAMPVVIPLLLNDKLEEAP